MNRIEEFIPNTLLPLEPPDVCLHPDNISPGDLVRSSFNRNAIGLVLGFTHERKVRVLWQEDPGPQVVINMQPINGTPRKLRAKWSVELAEEKP